MMYEYAVSPALFDSEAHVAFLYEAFGLGSGRLISEYPHKKWDRIVRAVINQNAIGDLQRHAWVEVLVALFKRARYERPGSRWTDEISWLDNAIVEHCRSGRPGFRGILVDGATGAHADVVALGAGISRHPCWPCPRDKFVPRSAEAIVKAVSPLLDLSTSVILIDRNFRPGDGAYVSVLEQFAKYLESNGALRPIRQISYVVSDINLAMDEMETQCGALIPANVPRGFVIKFVVLPKQLLHDRFVLTDVGAVQYGQGLDEAGLYEANGEVLVTRLGEESLGTLNAKWKVWTASKTSLSRRMFSVSGTA